MVGAFLGNWARLRRPSVSGKIKGGQSFVVGIGPGPFSTRSKGSLGTGHRDRVGASYPSLREAF